MKNEISRFIHHCIRIRKYLNGDSCKFEYMRTAVVNVSESLQSKHLIILFNKRKSRSHTCCIFPECRLDQLRKRKSIFDIFDSGKSSMTQKFYTLTNTKNLYTTNHSANVIHESAETVSTNRNCVRKNTF